MKKLSRLKRPLTSRLHRRYQKLHSQRLTFISPQQSLVVEVLGWPRGLRELMCAMDFIIERKT